MFNFRLEDNVVRWCLRQHPSREGPTKPFLCTWSLKASDRISLKPMEIQVRVVYKHQESADEALTTAITWMQSDSFLQNSL